MHTPHAKLGLRLLLTAGLLSQAAMHASTPTQTTLTVSPATYQGTHVYLTATVTANGAPVTRGIVNFCNAVAAHCTDVNILAQQAIVNGAAKLTLLPAAGTHEYRAVYQGTETLTPSISSVQTLSIETKNKTITRLSVSPDQKSLRGTVTSFGNQPPTGPVNFFTVADPENPIASANLGPAQVALTNSFTILPQPGYQPSATLSADLNRDGIPDLVTESYKEAKFDLISVFIGRGDGTFHNTAAISFPIDSSSSGGGAGLSFGDVNGDGIPDILAFPGASEVLTYLGKGDGTFLPVRKSGNLGSGTFATFTVADINRDGLADLLETYETSTADGPNDSTNTLHLQVLTGKGDGTFTAGWSTSNSYDCSEILCYGAVNIAVQVADLNFDGRPDIVWQINEGSQFNQSTISAPVSTFLNMGDGRFSPKSGFLPPQTNCPGEFCINVSNLILADITGDGIPDLLYTADPNGTPGRKNVQLAVLPGKGDGSFGEAILTATSQQYSAPGEPYVYDYNGDGIPDLVGLDYFLATVVFLSNGNGTFQPNPIHPLPYQTYVANFGVADFNHDGLPDVVTVDYNGKTYVALESLYAGGTASNVTIPGSGTQQVYASKPGDATHIGSTSTALPVKASN